MSQSDRALTGSLHAPLIEIATTQYCTIMALHVPFEICQSSVNEFSLSYHNSLPLTTLTVPVGYLAPSNSLKPASERPSGIQFATAASGQASGSYYNEAVIIGCHWHYRLMMHLHMNRLGLGRVALVRLRVTRKHKTARLG